MSINRDHQSFNLTPAQQYRFTQACLLEAEDRPTSVPGYVFNPVNNSVKPVALASKPVVIEEKKEEPKKKETVYTPSVGDKIQTKLTGKTGIIVAVNTHSIIFKVDAGSYAGRRFRIKLGAFEPIGLTK